VNRNKIGVDGPFVVHASMPLAEAAKATASSKRGKRPGVTEVALVDST